MNQPLRIWVLADDRAGNVAQAVGVAEALGLPFETKDVRYSPVARLPNAVQGASRLGLTPETRMAITPPWPDLVIAAGRRTAPLARWLKRQNARAFLAQIMNPGRAGADEFDLIAIPAHDCKLPDGDAPNVMRTIGAPHRVTPSRLAMAGEVWSSRLGGIPRPFIAVIAGGATNRRPFPTALAADFGRQAARMAAEVKGSVLLTTSRRTGADAEQALVSAIPEPRRTFLWGGGGSDNPYMGFLALADAIVVTGDSVSMCSEACASPAPVYIFAPNDMVSPKHARLHAALYEGGFARPFTGRYDDWTHPPLNAAHDSARVIETKLKAR